MDTVEIRDRTRPFYPAIRHACEMGTADVMAAIRLIGHVRKGERANIFHAAMRESFRVMCDVAEPFIELIEEPDGQGLDALQVTLDGQSHALRWARYNVLAMRFNRNSTGRTVEMQNQAYLFGDFFDPNGLPTATIGIEIADDVVEVMQPQWWLERLALRRERVDSTEFIDEIASYTQPIRCCDVPDPRTAAFIAARNQSLSELEEITSQIISDVA